jgi:charged multivesicular body protein 4A/B
MHIRTIDKVDATMASIQEQTQVANEISEAISNPMYGAGEQIDEVRGSDLFAD